MATVTKLEVKHNIFERCIGGNTSIEPKNHLSECLNAYINTPQDLKAVTKGTFLTRSTIRRMCSMEASENGRDYNPSSDTIDRITRFFGLELSYHLVQLKSRYRNKEKEF